MNSKMDKVVKYQWRTSIFEFDGKEFTHGYFDSKQSAINTLIDEHTPGFIILDDPRTIKDMQEVEYIKLIKDKNGNVSIHEVIVDKKAKNLYSRKFYEELQEIEGEVIKVAL